MIHRHLQHILWAALWQKHLNATGCAFTKRFTIDRNFKRSHIVFCLAEVLYLLRFFKPNEYINAFIIYLLCRAYACLSKTLWQKSYIYIYSNLKDALFHSNIQWHDPSSEIILMLICCSRTIYYYHHQLWKQLCCLKGTYHAKSTF